jgi:hypothetical protein
MVSGLHRNVDKVCARLGHYAPRVVILYRHFGTTDQFHLQGSRSSSLGPIGRPETSAQSCHYTLRNIPEESRSN